MKQICKLTGKSFEVTAAELALRTKFDLTTLPTTAPEIRWQRLGAFWQHWNLHKRVSDFSGKSLISVFSADCPYPVWQRDEWLAHAAPPSIEIDPTAPFFTQLLPLFHISFFSTIVQKCSFL